MKTGIFHEFVEKNEKNICQIVCYKNGKEVYSETWNGYKETDAVHVMSATKSIVSILIGICIDKGLIHSLGNTLAVRIVRTILTGLW